MSNEKKVLIQFAPEQQSPTLEIGHGEYSRKFDAKDSPFECPGFARKEVDGDGKETGSETVVMTAAEEAAMLLGTGYFVEATEDGRRKTVAGPQSSVAQGKIGGAPVGASEEQSAKS
jgi:hypothetical protein